MFRLGVQMMHFSAFNTWIKNIATKIMLGKQLP